MADTLRAWQQGTSVASFWPGNGWNMQTARIATRLHGWRGTVQDDCCGCRIWCQATKQSSYQQTSGGSGQKKPQSPPRNGKKPGGKSETGSSKSLGLAQQDGRPKKSSKTLDSSAVGDVEGLAKVLATPPAGFVLDGAGNVVVMAPLRNRIVTLVDPTTGRPLECVVRRSFLSTDGLECLLLTPVDMALQILKIEEESEGLRDLTDEELEDILPTASYALAKIRLHLVSSGLCLTARGGFCYSEEDVIDLNTEYGEGLGGSLAEGVEIINFYFKDVEYIIYTPFDPLMFVAHKDEETGELRIADNELLDDDAVLEAIDEENEFQAMVEEEEAVNKALRETQGRA